MGEGQGYPTFIKKGLRGKDDHKTPEKGKSAEEDSCVEGLFFS